MRITSIDTVIEEETMNDRDYLKATGKEIDLFDVKGLPQRTRMCFSCPTRLFHIEPKLEEYRKPHRCHNSVHFVCAGAITSSEEGIRILQNQIYDEANGKSKQ